MPVPLLAEYTVTTTFMVFAILAIAAQSVMLFLALFDRGLRYRITSTNLGDLEPKHFLHMLEAITDARLNTHTKLEVHANGENFYEAELEAIRQAKSSINLEAYIFQPGKVADRFLEALTERAKAGVKVRLLLDAVGCAGTNDSYLQPLKDAGGQHSWYHALRFSKLPRYNNRTHREILTVDGKVAFVGGAGFSDHWLISSEKHKRWRDTVFRIEGEAVAHLQATFAENWLEGCGELMAGAAEFPIYKPEGDTPVLVVNSTPSAGGSTRARILFQVLMASAQKSIHITTPYFLPDDSICHELKEAVRRGVDVRILVPGKKADHLLTRSSSRRAYGRLLKAGIRIWEYEPSMLHAKVLQIDDHWTVFGSTNFDNRSFGLNDEVNVAVMSDDFAERVQRDFVADVASSREITFEAWKSRPLFERVPELFGWVLERQQ